MHRNSSHTPQTRCLLAHLALRRTALLALIATLGVTPSRGLAHSDSTPEAPPRSDEISTERAALYAAIDALDEDFETGKLAVEDHARMRDELRARAAQLLAQERAQPETQPEPAAPTACPACDAELPPDARFCAQCGKALAETEQSGS